jgi:aminopeptidase N
MSKYITILAIMLLVPSAFARTNQTGLSEVEAQKRANLISEVHYDLDFSIIPAKDYFYGTSMISFDLKSVPDELTVDFDGGKVQAVMAEGKKLTYDYNDKFITLKSGLKKGANKLSIIFEHPYSKDGSGLYRFNDPEDKETYLYTDFEPYDANKLFPHFDQPDLKATYTVAATVPKHWVVITSTRETSQSPSKMKDFSDWVFPKSKKFSSYIFSFHAGPYKIWEDKEAKIPSRLLVRQSMAKYVDPQEWFTPTRQGFEFFAKYFDYAYPFVKYDQIIVPDFNSGAMENVAAVTFSERYVSRGAESRDDRERRASVILHEMAHMWFGNLVTMKWWDDLWLNESFATYMAAKAMYEATEFEESWRSFYDSMKQWAYWEDQLVTTHPILTPVPSTEQAFANFDGITYGKGASVLKQIDYVLGEAAFKKGVQNYFKKHAFSNATLSDFVGSLGKAHGKPLTQWSTEWLEKESLNSIRVEYSCQGGKIAKFQLIQSAPEQYPTLRQHKTEIGLIYKGKDGSYEVGKTLPVLYSKDLTPLTSSFKGDNCPDGVYPNYRDNDYVKVQLDGKSEKLALSGISKIKDPMLRSMFWQAMWDMVRDGKMVASKYFTLLEKNMDKEDDVKIVKSILSKAVGKYHTSSGVVHYYPHKTNADLKVVQTAEGKLEALIWKGLEEAEPGSNLQKEYFHYAVRSTTSEAKQKKLLAMLTGKEKFKDLEIDQDKRWHIIKQLSLLGAKGINALAKQEKGKDGSSMGQQAFIASEVLRPEKNLKLKWYKAITMEKPTLSLAEMKQVMYNSFPPSQIQITKQVSGAFFKDLDRLLKTADSGFLRSFARGLAPSFCDSESEQNLKKYLKSRPNLNPSVMKTLRVEMQENQRCQRARKLMATNGTSH